MAPRAPAAGGRRRWRLYLQGAYVLAFGAVYLGTSAPEVLAANRLQPLPHASHAHPVLKYDGYWLLSDLSGTHNLHQCSVA